MQAFHSFLLSAAVLSAAVASVFLFRAFRRGGGSGEPRGWDAGSMLADELSGLRARKERGEVDEALYEKERDDVARRAIGELGKGGGSDALKAGRRWTAALFCAVFVPIAAAGIYSRLGSPELVNAEAGFSRTGGAAGGSEAAMRLEAEKRGAALEDMDETALAAWCMKHPEDGRANVMYGRMLAERRDFEAAYGFYDAALTHDPRSVHPATLAEAAAVLMSMEERASLAARLKKAADLLDRALAIEPGFGSALRLRAYAAAGLGDWAKAADCLSALAAKFPEGSAERARLEEEARAALRSAAP